MIIHNNIESLTERGERLEHLDQRTRTSFVASDNENENGVKEAIEMDGLRESLERLMADGVLTPSFSDLDDLSIHAQTFKTQATTTRRKFWWKNKKVRLLFSPPLPPSSLAVYLLPDLTY